MSIQPLTADNVGINGQPECQACHSSNTIELDSDIQCHDEILKGDDANHEQVVAPGILEYISSLAKSILPATPGIDSASPSRSALSTTEQSVPSTPTNHQNSLRKLTSRSPSTRSLQISSVGIPRMENRDGITLDHERVSPCSPEVTPRVTQEVAISVSSKQAMLGGIDVFPISEDSCNSDAGVLDSECSVLLLNISDWSEDEPILANLPTIRVLMRSSGKDLSGIAVLTLKRIFIFSRMHNQSPQNILTLELKKVRTVHVGIGRQHFKVADFKNAVDIFVGDDSLLNSWLRIMLALPDVSLATLHVHSRCKFINNFLLKKN
jgi:hypothetical protein